MIEYDEILNDNEIRDIYNSYNSWVSNITESDDFEDYLELSKSYMCEIL